MSDKGVLVIISGPSGVGKTSVRNAVLAADANTCFSVSATTRQPRQGEVHGRDYFFISAEEFAAREANGEFLETAQVYGHRYGTLAAQVEARLNSGRNVILDIDTEGAARIRAFQRPDMISIFIMPPSQAELRRRIIDRHTEQGEALQQRIALAEAEMAVAGLYDYQVVNDNVPACAQAILEIIAASRQRINGGLAKQATKEANLVKQADD